MAMSKTELLPLEGAISGIWRFFGFPAKDGQIVEKDKKRNEVTFQLFPGSEVCVKYNQHAVPFADSPPPRICCNGVARKS